MNKVVVGGYIVDLDGRRLFSADCELTVEPKVIEVLCYLIAQRERFVSLHELHENVWAGRVVTDTAVRKTISKLRQLLNDTDADNPQYIKSQMKRGYQLICPVSLLAEESVPASAYLASTSDLPSSSNTFIRPQRFNRLLIAGPLLLLCIGLLYLAFKRSTSAPARMFEVETLLSIPGQKTSLTVSKDGRLQAFVAKVDESRSWELFLYDNKVGQLQKVATPEGDSRFVSFIANDSKLVYVVYTNNQASLYTQQISNLNEPPELLPTPDYPFLYGPLPLPDNQLLIAAGKELRGNVHYYKYDMLLHNFEQFTYSDMANIQDTFASISPDQKSVALGRVDIESRKINLQLYRLADKELLAEYLLQNKLSDFKLSWVDKTKLLVRLGSIHQLLWTSDGTRQPVEVTPHSLHEFHFTANGDLYALDNQIQDRKTFQVTWPFKANFDKNFQFGPEVTAVWFSTDSEYLWLRTLEDNETRLYRYYPADNQRQLVLASTEYLFISDQSSDGERLLLKHNNRYEIYNVTTGQTVAVTISTQNVHSASFTVDEQAVIFAEKVHTSWQTKRFDLITKKQAVLLQNYQYLAESQDGYVGATPDGEIWLLDKVFNRREMLCKVSFIEFNYDLQVRGDKLIIVTRDLMGDWILHNINLTTLDKWQRKIPFYEFSLTYSLDTNAENLIYRTLEKQENHLVKYGYNFGYNLVSQ